MQRLEHLDNAFGQLGILVVGKRIPEYTLDIPANVTVDSSAPTLYGSHELSGPQVQEFFDLLDEQLVRFWAQSGHTVAQRCAHM